MSVNCSIAEIWRRMSVCCGGTPSRGCRGGYARRCKFGLRRARAREDSERASTEPRGEDVGMEVYMGIRTCAGADWQWDAWWE